MNAILPDFVLYRTRPWLQTMDNPWQCLDKEHFKNYPHTVSYNFNSRGFRDEEWPATLEELKESVWCIGDSFTFAVGAPVEHNWPSILQSKINRRCINISLCGSSNEWILRKAKRISEDINPVAIVAHLSYTHRGEKINHTLTDESRRLKFKYLSDESAMGNAIHVLQTLKQLKTPVITSFIPNSGFIPEKSTIALDVPLFNAMDYARDGKHYDILTATHLANCVSDILRDRINL